MDKNGDNIFSDLYNDFFGDGKILNKNKSENYKNLNDIEEVDFPKIEVKEDYELTQEKEVAKVPSIQSMNIDNLDKEKIDELLNKIFEQIEKLPITEESKNTLKKMIIYARKYKEGTAKNYIPFNLRIYCDNDKTLYSITDIIRDSLVFLKYIPRDEAVESTFYLIDDVAKLNEMYNKKNTIVVIKDISVLNSKDQKIKDKLLNVWEDLITENENSCVTIVVDKDKSQIDEAFSNNMALKDKIFSLEIETKLPNTQEIYNELIEKLEVDNELSEDFKVKILDYIIATFPKTTLSYPEYIELLYEKILFNKSTDKIESKDIPEYEKEKTNEEIFAELNELVGLESVKAALNDLVSLMEFKNKTQDKIKIKDTNLHMVFLGNPGTGKTTVARMIAGILYNLKYINQNKLIEVSAKDLVAEYVGQTGPKTMAVIEKAMGGVLFIDEAYSLASKQGEGNSFNEECIATLIQAMENYRDNLVVIFAGYSKEMQDFLKMNSGIVSRIGYTLTFEDYTVDQLIVIFKSMIKKAGFEIEEEAIEKAKSIIEEYKNTENFGNARFVRNLYEKTVIKHATNTKDKKRISSLRKITAEDVVSDNLLKM
jgi:Holliday junction resolvasome RuvABC ATP-dependent DNA helicase subunit